MKKRIPSVCFRRLTVIFLCLSLCLFLGSCSFSLEDTMVRLKAYINGTEIYQPPEDFIESRENDLYGYDLYETYVVLTRYKGEATIVSVPKELDGRPVTTIGELAFYYGTAVESVTLPNTVTTLEENAFYYCRALKKITLPDSVTSIGDKCFSWCSSLTGIKLPKSVKAIPDYCFNECASLEVVSMPAGLTTVGVRAFSGCASLTELSFGEAVTSVGSLAFRDCGSLTSLRLPGACSVGTELFNGCGDGLRVMTEKGSACWNSLLEQGLRVAESGISLRLPKEGEAPVEPSEPSEASEETESSDIPSEE